MVNRANFRIISLIITLVFLCTAIAGCSGGGKTNDGASTLAAFSADGYHKVVYQCSEGGSIVGETEQKVKQGEDSTQVKALANEGYVFVGWSDGKTDAERIECDVTADVTVSAIFKQVGEKFTVTYELFRNGKSLQKRKLTAVVGESVSFEAPAPAFAYSFSWSDGKTAVKRSDTAVLDGQTIIGIYTPVGMDTPIISINTRGSTEISSKREYKGCEVSLSNASEEYCFEAVEAEIRGRGNSSWDHHEKKSYRIKFAEKRSMLGSEYKARSWTLIASHADGTLSRNALAYEFSSRLDDIAFTTMHEYVEVFVNGEYQGTYLLCDQIQAGEGRIDVEQELTGDADTGYFILLDGRASWDGTKDLDYFTLSNDKAEKQYDMRTPDPDDPAYDPNIYLKYIQNYMDEALAALSSENWSEICKYIEPETFADVYIVNELFLNIDCGNLSFYFYKEKGGKLCCGPVWDFDLCLGNSHYGPINGDYNQPDGDLQKNGSLWAASQNTWFRRLLRTEEFTDIVKAKLQKYTPIFQEIISLADVNNANGLYKTYEDSLLRNFERWDILGQYVWPNPSSVYLLDSVKDHFVFVHDWMKARHDVVLKEYGVK